jgi:hypothetical protein
MRDEGDSVDLRVCQVAVNKRKFLVLMGVKRWLLGVHRTKSVILQYRYTLKKWDMKWWT